MLEWAGLAISLLLLFGPAVLAAIVLHKCLSSDPVHVRVIAATMASLFVCAVVGAHIWSARLHSVLDNLETGSNLAAIPFRPKVDYLGPETGEFLENNPSPARTVRHLGWSDPVGERSWFVQADPQTGTVLHVSGLYLCGSDWLGVVGSFTYAAGALVLMAVLSLGMKGARALFSRRSTLNRN